MNNPAEEEWITVNEAARILGVSPWTVRTWIRRRRGPAHYRIGPKTIRFRRAEVEEYLEDVRVATEVRS